MCIFSGPVNSINNTRIFARRDGHRQILVYSMNYAASDQVAMLLPIPVAAGHGEQAVVFINLQGYARFFEDLASAFLVARSGPYQMALSAAPAPLRVHDVGKFEASYVPGIADFDRLDPRFRLPDHLWSHLPRYRDWGFAVFKLKATVRQDSDAALPAPQQVHPMAFSFPSRLAEGLFFPTVHIHEGQWSQRARFDHELYCQYPIDPACASADDWTQSNEPIKAFMDSQRSEGTIDPDAPCWQRLVAGDLPNEDIWLTGDLQEGNRRLAV